jgi:hypothetical protein
MQRIEIVAGDDVVGQSIQDIFTALVAPGILSGFTLSVSGGNSIQIAPGSGLFDSGAFIFEDEVKITDPLPIPSGPQDFTVLYLFTPTNSLGGTPATLVVQPGLVNPDTFTGGLVLGWVRYAGGPTLDIKTFIPGRRIKVTVPKEKQKNEFVVTFAPLSTKWALVSGPSLALAEGWVGAPYNAIQTAITNTTASVQTAVYQFPLIIPSTGLGQLLVECEVPNTSNLSISFIDTAGIEYIPSGGAWTFIASPMQSHVLTVPQNLALQAGGVAYMKFTLNMQPGSFQKFEQIGYSSYTEPF